MERQDHFPWENDIYKFPSLIVRKEFTPFKGSVIIHLETPRLSKLASSWRNTRKNLDDKQTKPVFDPKKILKTRGFLKQTIAAYQPKYT